VHEHAKLAAIFVKREPDSNLTDTGAPQLMARDAPGAHAYDKLGMSDTLNLRPVQAALPSTGTFAVGAAGPITLVLVVPVSSPGLFRTDR
jgi:hypothetical protein